MDEMDNMDVMDENILDSRTTFNTCEAGAQGNRFRWNDEMDWMDKMDGRFM